MTSSLRLHPGLSSRRALRSKNTGVCSTALLGVCSRPSVVTQLLSSLSGLNLHLSNWLQLSCAPRKQNIFILKTVDSSLLLRTVTAKGETHRSVSNIPSARNLQKATNQLQMSRVLRTITKLLTTIHSSLGRRGSVLTVRVRGRSDAGQKSVGRRLGR